jgi:lysophospholipase L1-like esterase
MKKPTLLKAVLFTLTLTSLNIVTAQNHIAADDSKIQYTGRINFADPLQPKYSFPGISIKAKFNGTGVKGIIHDYGTGAAGTTNYYKVLIDGAIVQEQLKVDPGNKTYDLATGLSAGDHIVEIIKITEGASGVSSFIGFEVEGGAQTSIDLPARLNKKIEFIGDSWTCGYGNLSQFASGNGSMANSGYVAANEDNYYAWGPISARAVGAECQVTAISGRGLFRNNWHSDNSGTATGTLPKNYDNIVEDDDAVSYDHSWNPDVVVIHLGTNDMAAEGEIGQSAELNDAKFQNTYKDFMEKILGYHPCAKIIMCYGNSKSDGYPGWTKQLTRLRTIAQNLEAMYPDGNVKGLELSYTAESWPAASDDCGYGDAWHPSLCSHEEMSAELVTKINSISANWGTSTGCSYTYNPIVLATNVGMFDVAHHETMNIFPNPANEQINIKGNDNNQWIIVNQLGVQVLNGTESIINVSNLSPGIYYLKSTTSLQNVMGRFIKK